MSRPCPVAPGWWWREHRPCPPGIVPYVVYVREAGGHLWIAGGDTAIPVLDDGRWLAPVATPAEVDALRERAERAEAERDEARAELAAERGEAAGALPGWVWDEAVLSWRRPIGLGSLGPLCLMIRRAGRKWRLYVGGDWLHDDRAFVVGAREAMRAAEAAARAAGLLTDEVAGG